MVCPGLGVRFVNSKRYFPYESFLSCVSSVVSLDWAHVWVVRAKHEEDEQQTV